MELALERIPLWLNAAVFAAAAAGVWFSGVRLAGYAEAIARRTRLGSAFIGALLLGGISSLPEAVTTGTAAALGNAPIAVNNLLGGVAMQVAVLSLADILARGPAISAEVDQSAVLLQVTMLMVILAVAGMGIVAGDELVLGFGMWSLLIAVLAVGAFVLIRWHPDRAWVPSVPPSGAVPAGGGGSRAARSRHEDRPGTAERQDAGRPASADSLAAAPFRALGTGALTVRTALASVGILASGAGVALTADALAEQTGLGSDFVGAVFVAAATSLPEISTTIAAVRLGDFTLAFSNVFGANILDIGLLTLADGIYPGPPVLAEVGRFSLITALLGIVLAGVYSTGLLRRRRRVVFGMGLDSLLVLVLYAGGLILLYHLR